MPPSVRRCLNSGDYCEILYLEYHATRLNHDIPFRGTIMKADLLPRAFMFLLPREIAKTKSRKQSQGQTGFRTFHDDG